MLAVLANSLTTFTAGPSGFITVPLMGHTLTMAQVETLAAYLAQPALAGARRLQPSIYIVLHYLEAVADRINRASIADEDLLTEAEEEEVAGPRTVSLRVGGMFCS